MVEGVEEVERKLHLIVFVNVGDFSNARIEILEPEAAERIAAASRGICGELNRTKFRQCGGRIAKIIDSGALRGHCACWMRTSWRVASGTGAAKRSANVVVDATTEGTGADERHFAGGKRKDRSAAENLVAFLDEEG